MTQNIDGLHQMAGSRKVLELHGSIHRNFCQKCGAQYDAQYIKEGGLIPKCEKCGGVIKPDVVLYEECLNDHVMSEAIYEIGQADMMIIGGTSLVVYPAAGLIHYYRGKKLVLINKSATSQDRNANLVIQGKIGEILNEIKVR